MKLTTFFIGLVSISATLAAGPTASQVGSYGPIQASGSDAQSVQFNSLYSSTISPYLLNNSSNGNLNGSYSFTNSGGGTVLNSANNSIPITATNTSVRFYYVYSSAAYTNSAGAAFNSLSVNAGNNNVLFPTNQPNPGPATGSFVNIPGFLANGSLNLYLLANQNASSSANVWWSSQAANSDGLSHVQVAEFLGSSPNDLFYLIAWDDEAAGGTDRDFNDFTIVAELVQAPEPSFYLILGSLITVAFVVRAKIARRQSVIG